MSTANTPQTMGSPSDSETVGASSSESARPDGTTSPKRIEPVPGFWVAWRHDFTTVACLPTREAVLEAVAAEGLSLDDVVIAQFADAEHVEYLGVGSDMVFVGEDMDE